MTHAVNTRTLRHALWGDQSPMKSAALLIAGSMLLTLSAKVSVPFYPVPMTMQSFAVLFLGFALGARLGAATVLVYLAQGAVGIPVFAAPGAGVAHMMGPTGGYLLGFVAAAWVTGALAERGFGRTLPGTISAAVLGLFALYLPGLAWLGTVAGWDKPIMELGLLPFLPGEALKLALLAAVLPLAWRRVIGRRGG